MLHNLYIVVGVVTVVVWVLLVAQWLRDSGNQLPVARVVRNAPGPKLVTVDVAQKIPPSNKKQTS